MSFTAYDALDQGTRSLVDWQYHRHGDFFTALWDAICRADTENLAKLELGFPKHVQAYRKYTSVPGWWTAVEEKLELRHSAVV